MNKLPMCIKNAILTFVFKLDFQFKCFLGKVPHADVSLTMEQKSKEIRTSSRTFDRTFYA